MAKSIKTRVKEFRLARLWTQKQMAAAVGVSVGTIMNIERGNTVSDLTQAKVDRFINLQTVAA